MEDATSLKIGLLYAAYTVVGLFYAANETRWSSILLGALVVLLGQGLMVQLVLRPFLWNPLGHLPVGRGFKPIIGHSMLTFRKPTGSGHLQLMKETPNDGLILTRGLFHANKLILASPAAIADVLVNKSYDFEKPAWARNFLRRFLGDGLLMTEGDEHKHHRKLIMPAFHFRHIKELYPVFWSKSIDLCNTLNAVLQEDPDRVLEIGHYSTQVTLDIIGLAGLGRDIRSLHNSNDELIATYEEILEPTTEKGIYFLLHLLFPSWFIGALPWRLNKRVKITTDNLKRICTEFVAERKANMKNECSNNQNNRDILSIMIRSNNFSDQNLVDQLLTFLAAGHETTSSALTWACYLLATHPSTQHRLRLELHASIPNPTLRSTPPFDIAPLLETMPFLNAVCNEVLRLFPSIPTTSRVAIRPTSVAGHPIPQHTTVLAVPWAINRNPLLWGADAADFVPERWIDAATGRATMHGGAASNFAFLTFLHGPRSCIGERFARAELRALVGALVGGFEMEMADLGDQVVVGGVVTSKPVGGMRLRLRGVGWVV